MPEVIRSARSQPTTRVQALGSLSQRVARDLTVQGSQGGMAVEIARAATERGMRELQAREQRA